MSEPAFYLGTGAPTILGTGAPTIRGTGAPTIRGTGAPTILGTGAPTIRGTGAPTIRGTGAPTILGTGAPTIAIGDAEAPMEPFAKTPWVVTAFKPMALVKTSMANTTTSRPLIRMTPSE